MSVPVDAAPVFHRRRSSSRTFRDILSCRSIDVEENEEDEPMTTMMTEDMAAEEYPEQLVRSASSPASSSSSSSVLPRPSTHFTTCHRATLILKTRKENEPLIRVLRGTCKLKGLQLRHVCHGTGTFKIYYYIHVTLLFAASSLTSRLFLLIYRYLEWKRCRSSSASPSQTRSTTTNCLETSSGMFLGTRRSLLEFR